MIVSWEYNFNSKRYEEVKNLISSNNYSCIDIGGYANFWSYPECKNVADAYKVDKDDVNFFKINIEDRSTWSELIEHTKVNGKFDFSICSHTLEDIFNPFELIELLETISYRGFIAVPSKYDELTKLYENRYRGNAHHKQFFDMIDGTFVVFPKYSWVEIDERSNNISKLDKGRELSLLWETKIPTNIFNSGTPFNSDEQLINEFYSVLTN